MRSVASPPAGRTVEVTETGLRLTGGGDLRLVSGAVHYWRHDPADWRAIIDSLSALGFGCIDTYVPWSVHENPDGSTEWSGSRDVETFLRLVDASGLRCVVRAGPHCGCELSDSGIPRRVHTDTDVQARRCNGRPYILPTATHHIAVPSYESTRFRDAVDGWYAAVVPRLAAHQWPEGPIVACQVDNEHGYFFQDHPYALDYHPEAVDAYRGWLEQRYGGDIAGLNSLYGSDLASFAAVDPPRDGSDEPELRRLDWVEWREVALRNALAWLRGRLAAHGMDRVPFYHNDYPRTDTPLDQGALEQSGAVDVAALDVYATRYGAGYVSDVARHAAGTSRLPWLAESGAGWLTLPWLLPMAVEPLDAEFTMLAAFLSGIRALNLYMAVERDRWYGSPIDRHGNARDAAADPVRRVLELLQVLRLEELTRDAPVLLVENRAQGRRRAARATLGGIIPAFSGQLPFDFRLASSHDEEDERYDAWLRNAALALKRAGVDHDRASSSSLRDLDRYTCVVVACVGALDRAACELLDDAASRGCAVIAGPDAPTQDQRLQPMAAGMRWTRVDDPAAFATLLPQPAYRCDAEEVAVHVWRSDAREVVAALNHSADEVRVTLRAAGTDATLLPRWRAEPPLHFDGGVAEFSLPAFGAQVWERAS